MHLLQTPNAFENAISDEHLARARAKEEPFYHGGFTLSEIVEPDNGFGTAMDKAEDQVGMLEWLELPRYPIPGVEQPNLQDSEEPPLLVKSMVGVGEDATIVIESSDLTEVCFDRSIWCNGDTGGLTADVWLPRGEDHRATIRICVVLNPNGVTFTRRHKEHIVGGDMYAARCSAVMKFMERVRRLERAETLNAMAVIIDHERNLIARSCAEITALCCNIEPPSPKKSGWEVEFIEYLGGFGMTAGTITDLLNGRKPNDVGMGFDWETKAVLTLSGEFRVTHDAMKTNGEMLLRFPSPPTTDAARAEYFVELRSAMEASQRAIADLPRVKRIAREYNLPVKRYWL